MSGGMAEWLKAAVLKTVNGETRSGVRIPLPPPPTWPDTVMRRRSPDLTFLAEVGEDRLQSDEVKG
jgi:hypothetical protein